MICYYSSIEKIYYFFFINTIYLSRVFLNISVFSFCRCDKYVFRIFYLLVINIWLVLLSLVKNIFPLFLFIYQRKIYFQICLASLVPVTLRNRWHNTCTLGVQVLSLHIFREGNCWADKLANLGHSIHGTLPLALLLDFIRDRCGLPNYKFP